MLAGLLTGGGMAPAGVGTGNGFRPRFRRRSEALCALKEAVAGLSDTDLNASVKLFGRMT